MLMLTFLIKTLMDTYIMLFLMRTWMQCSQCDFYHPFSQLVVKMTQPMIGLVRRVFPMIGLIDTASLFLAFILAIVQFPLLTLIGIRIIILEPIYLLVGPLTLLKLAGRLVFWVIIIRSLLSWSGKERNQMELILYQLSEPLLSPIRRFLPATPGLDLSSMFLVIILYALNYLGMDLFQEIWYRI